MPHYPGSGTDQAPPTAPAGVSKRLGTNLGVEGIELSWSPSHDDNWISYYEIRRTRRLSAGLQKEHFSLITQTPPATISTQALRLRR